MKRLTARLLLFALLALPLAAETLDFYGKPYVPASWTRFFNPFTGFGLLNRKAFEAKRMAALDAWVANTVLRGREKYRQADLTCSAADAYYFCEIPSIYSGTIVVGLIHYDSITRSVPEGYSPGFITWASQVVDTSGFVETGIDPALWLLNAARMQAVWRGAGQ